MLNIIYYSPICSLYIRVGACMLFSLLLNSVISVVLPSNSLIFHVSFNLLFSLLSF